MRKVVDCPQPEVCWEKFHKEGCDYIGDFNVNQKGLLNFVCLDIKLKKIKTVNYFQNGD